MGRLMRAGWDLGGGALVRSWHGEREADEEREAGG